MNKMAIWSRGPKFKVATNILVFLTAAAVALKLASAYLPERRPNRLGLEYGAYVQLASRQQVAWYPFSPEAFEKAKTNNQLILLELGSVYSRRSKILTDVNFQDYEMVRLLNNHFVAIRADTSELPGVVDAIELNTPTLTRGEGSLIIILDPEGKFLDAKVLAIPEGKESLYDYLAQMARSWVQDSDKLLQKARENELARRAASLASDHAGPIDERIAMQFAQALAAEVDPTLGSMRNLPSPVSAPPPDLLLFAGSIGAREWQEKGALWLLRMRESAAYDNVWGGFFWRTNAPNWREPGYGKRAGMNAQLGAVYARAAVLLDSEAFSITARQIANWLLSECRDPETGLFFEGVGTDEGVLRGSPYYDWTDNALPRLRRVSIEAAGGANTLRLSASRSLREGAGRDAAAAMERAQDVLQPLTRERTAPVTDSAMYAQTNAQVVSGLSQIVTQLQDAEMLRKATLAFRRVESTFIEGIGDVFHARAGTAHTTGYAGDYVWFARAALDCAIATGDVGALRVAEEVTARFRELFYHPSGGYYSQLQSQSSFAGFVVPVRQIADNPDISVNSLAARNLYDLWIITGKSEYRTAAANVLAAFGSIAPKLGISACGVMYSVLLQARSAVLVLGADAVNEAAALRTQYPYVLVAPGRFRKDLAGKKHGLYIASTDGITGPLRRAELTRFLGY